MKSAVKARKEETSAVSRNIESQKGLPENLLDCATKLLICRSCCGCCVVTRTCTHDVRCLVLKLLLPVVEFPY